MSEEKEQVSQISEWYSGKCVFITGASGFLGKALMEKLLRSCPDIKTVYILLRSKRGVMPEDRLATLLKGPMYDNLRKNNPDNLKKIIPIIGDVMQPNLGICSEDRAELAQNVNVVFHSAATIKFNESINVAVNMNVIGTKQVINLALEMKYLHAFVHLSTAYSNCNRIEIEEKLYEPPIDLDKLKEIIKLLDDDTLYFLTPQLLKDWPNTYTFTKALAEQLVSEHARSGLPAVIVRPAIVTAAWQEPMPGWIDSVYGPTGVILGVAKGVIRSIPVDPNNIHCFIPLDIVINLVVSVAWNLGTNKCTTMPIFNCATGVINPLDQKKMINIFKKWGLLYPFDTALWHPMIVCLPNLLAYRIHNILTRTIPAYIMDFFLIITGKKTFAVKLSSKIDEMMNMYEYFVSKNWKFHSENIPKLLDTLSTTDKKTFNFDVEPMCWDLYCKDYHLGIKQYILKESMDNLPQAKARLQRLKIIYYSLSALFLFGFLIICLKYIF